MNKSKAKRLRKELEHEQRAADRGYQAMQKRLTKPRPTPKALTPVQKAVHFEEP